MSAWPIGAWLTLSTLIGMVGIGLIQWFSAVKEDRIKLIEAKLAECEHLHEMCKAETVFLRNEIGYLRDNMVMKYRHVPTDQSGGG